MHFCENFKIVESRPNCPYHSLRVFFSAILSNSFGLLVFEMVELESVVKTELLRYSQILLAILIQIWLLTGERLLAHFARWHLCGTRQILLKKKLFSMNS